MTPRNHLTERGGTVARQTKVRTTFEPGIVLSVGDAELLDLDRQGLIKSRESDEDWEPEDTGKAPASTDTKAAKTAKTEKGATS